MDEVLISHVYTFTCTKLYTRSDNNVLARLCTLTLVHFTFTNGINIKP